MSIRKILIANRGEIALRVIRTCREMGIKTVVVYSEADASSFHVKEADEAYCIGPEGSQNSYLNISKIMAKAMVAHVDSIHPGYGLLSENPKFAEACERYGFKFIGPRAGTIEAIGNKVNVKKIAKTLNIPTIPGSSTPVQTLEEAEAIAERIGYPILIKPAAGGGGRGLRVVYDKRTLKEYLEASRREASLSFAFAGVLIEKYLEKPRHIEVQILADQYGNVVHLGERDCSIQHKYQKLIEESPSPVITKEQREKVTGLALKLAKGINYTNAGTAEFLMDQQGNFYFIEMNCRIQVEHPVTEMVTGIDIVKEQINIAAGKPLAFSQKDIKFNGWALECRINAKDPQFGFRPNTGTITAYKKPKQGNVRIDDYIYSGYTIPMYYDSLISKVITWGQNREEAMENMKNALEQYQLEGIKTTIPFHKFILAHPVFIKGGAYTTFVEEILTETPGFREDAVNS
ncbi:MAG: acetyl-CoA carboxylase biotin carboxylase subunit [Bacillota bacterium]